MLIIKCDVMLRPEAFKDMAAEIARQCRGGSLVLPSYCHVVAEVPDGEEIKVVAERQPEIGDLLTITLDRTQWQHICYAVRNSRDHHLCKACEWEYKRADPKEAERHIKNHRQNAESAERILEVIDEALYTPALQEATYGRD